jgi:uncharacterized protein with HEPN domain
MQIKDRHSLESIIDAIERIFDYTKDIRSADDLFANNIAFDATMMNFIVIGEMVAKLTEEFKENYQEIEWNKIKGFRNIVAHDYFGIDAEEVWQIIRFKLPNLKKDIEKIIK